MTEGWDYVSASYDRRMRLHIVVELTSNNDMISMLSSCFEIFAFSFSKIQITQRYPRYEFMYWKILKIYQDESFVNVLTLLMILDIILILGFTYVHNKTSVVLVLVTMLHKIINLNLTLMQWYLCRRKSTSYILFQCFISNSSDSFRNSWVYSLVNTRWMWHSWLRDSLGI